jgi:stalled ribosome rescue protein Dom34
MKNVGIWIDKKEAKIVSIEARNEHLDTIVSDIQYFHPSEGRGTRLKDRLQDAVQYSKYLEREKHQLGKFFRDITRCITGVNAIVIFGPAQTGEKLYDKLLEKQYQFNPKTISIKKADKMTDSQIMAWVRNYYNLDNKLNYLIKRSALQK